MNTPRRRTVLRALAGGSLASVGGCSTSYGELPVPIPGTGGANSEGTDGITRETATLVPSERGANDRFGASVDLAAGTALVGAPRVDEPNGPLAGAAFVFTRTNGRWSRQRALIPSDGDQFDRFGSSVALSESGDVALIGAKGADDPNGENAGAVYAFERGTNGWAQVAKFAPGDGNSGDSFGSSLALADSTAIVGAFTDDDPNGIYGGSAYVYDGAEGAWTQQASLAAAEGNEHDRFATTVASTGDTAVIGAPGRTTATEGNQGTAYVFRRTDDGWHQRAILTPPQRDSDAAFGTSVALGTGGTTAVIGAPRDDPGGTKTGASYIFGRSAGEWTTVATLVPADGERADRFGHSIGVAGDAVLVSAKGSDDPNGENAGAVYVFSRSSNGWRKRTTLAPATGKPNDWFGWSIATSSGTALVSALKADAPDADNAGAAYVFELG